jgi:hypothetical protein
MTAHCGLSVFPARDAVTSTDGDPTGARSMPRTPLPRLGAALAVSACFVAAAVVGSPVGRAEDPPPASQPTAVPVGQLKALLPAAFGHMPQESVDTVADAGMNAPIAKAHCHARDSLKEFGDVSITDYGGSAIGLTMADMAACIGRDYAETAVVYRPTTVAGYPAETCTTKLNGLVTLNVVVAKRFIVISAGSLTMDAAAVKAAAEAFNCKSLAALAK